MVQQMIDAKLNENGPANSGAGFPVFEKQHPLLMKKAALRDVQNEKHNIIPKLPGNQPLQKGLEPLTDAAKFCGNKRLHCDSLSNFTSDQSPCNNGMSGQLVYVRRKTEQELGKTNTSNMENTGFQTLGKMANERLESHDQINPMQEPKNSRTPAFMPMPGTSLAAFPSGGPSLPHCFGKPVNGVTVAEPSYSLASTATTTGIPLIANRLRTLSQQREQRFRQLQIFLKNCDQSSQEDYIRMLRSLSPAGRNRQAVELEKRAINLFLEEGKEMQRVKALNPLGKSTPISYASSPIQAHVLQSVPVKREDNP